MSILDSPNNILGGTEPGAGNLFSGNNHNGVTIYNVNARGNLMQGNLVGTDLTGTVGLGNSLYGVLIEDAPSNTIGGTTEAARNIVSGNDSSGIVLLSRGAFENTVQGNFIGTDITGTFAIPNVTHSVIIDDAPRNLIGGLTAGARNIISGNSEGGVVIGGLDATGNIVQGNFIGTDVTGATAMGNDTDGVVMLDASANTIGGSAAGAGNLISGNKGNGILISGSGATNNLVQGNLIGTDFGGIAALSNGASGVSIQNASSNTIGGTTPEARNVISANIGADVTISGNGFDFAIGGDGTDTAAVDCEYQSGIP